jgi:hypothetical protein
MRYAVVVIALLAAACEEEKDSPKVAQRKAECRQLMEHIVQITPRPGGGGPETDPARVKQIVAKLPVEDIEQCAAIKDPAPPGGGGTETDPAKTPRAIACMQAAPDVAALRACIPAQTE